MALIRRKPLKFIGKKKGIPRIKRKSTGEAKECTSCHKMKDFNKFHLSSINKDGYQYYCIKCKTKIYHLKK